MMIFIKCVYRQEYCTILVGKREMLVNSGYRCAGALEAPKQSSAQLSYNYLHVLLLILTLLSNWELTISLVSSSDSLKRSNLEVECTLGDSP